MNGSNKEQTKPESELESSLPSLINLMTKIVEQNNILIEQSAAKEQLILQLIEQNDEILNELVDQEDDSVIGSKSLDMD